MIDDPRLHSERNVWLATARPDGRLHLVPVWFVWLRQCVFVCTSSHSVKVRNIAKNPSVAAALEDGDHPLIIEGQATLLLPPYPSDVESAFRQKYDWDIGGDSTHDVLIVLTPSKWLRW
jgi:hypothetical protein